MATFWGYTAEELECEGSEQQQIEHFLNIFRMPNCGARNTAFLREALQKAEAWSPGMYGMYVLTLCVSDLHNNILCKPLIQFIIKLSYYVNTCSSTEKQEGQYTGSVAWNEGSRE